MVVSTILITSTCKKCWCSTYLFAKPKKTSVESFVTSDLLKMEDALTNKDVHPGHTVLCDQYMPPTKGCLIHT